MEDTKNITWIPDRALDFTHMIGKRVSVVALPGLHFTGVFVGVDDHWLRLSMNDGEVTMSIRQVCVISLLSDKARESMEKDQEDLKSWSGMTGNTLGTA